MVLQARRSPRRKWNIPSILTAKLKRILGLSASKLAVVHFLPACILPEVDLVHFRVIATTMIGLITPPYGILFVGNEMEWIV